MRTFVEVITCDRCKEEFSFAGVRAITDLKWMVVRNGGGTANSNMSLDLCEDCADLFLNFMDI